MAGPSKHDQSGSTLPELAIAGLLMLTAIAMAGGTVLAPLGALERLAPIDVDGRRLDIALDTVALVVRAARPALEGPPVVEFEDVGSGTTLRLRVAGSGDDDAATLILSGSELRLIATAGADRFETGTLVDGLDVSRSRIEVISSSGAPVGASAVHEIAAVRVVLHRDGREAARTVHLRTVRPLGTVRR
jgi:hypothetical protein